jgi:alginate O-acetyltransferase complex protein AlgI
LNRFNSTRATAWTFRALAWATITWLVGWPVVLLMCVAALATQAAALAVHALRERPPAASTALVVAVAGELMLFTAALWPAARSIAIPVGAGVFMCHAVSYLVDVRRGKADPRRHVAALLYLVQLPVVPAGPLSRFEEFTQQLARADVSMGGFSYGVRRIVTGLIKVFLLAAPLASTADRIFALRVTRLSTDTAWLGAVCSALEVYFYFSGFSDVGIGLGRIIGFRHQENFRRPYTADSIREFWRGWNVTLITWLRDYLSLPIAGHGRPTFGLYLHTVAAFVVVGLWHRATLHVFPWALYFGTWLAIEALGLGEILQRLPRVLRHAYVLLVVTFGWMLLRVSGPGPLLGYVEAMLGLSVVKFGASSAYLTWDFVTALVCALIFAGPMVGNISRWRVSVDAATASLLMMLAATGVLLWHALNGIRRMLPRDAPRGPS